MIKSACKGNLSNAIGSVAEQITANLHTVIVEKRDR